MRKPIVIVTVVCAALVAAVLAEAQTTAFKYQGSLTDTGSPANGTFQMQFKLFDAVSGGTQIGSTVTNTSVPVANGVFSVSLDFGSNALSGANRWLEIAVRRNSGESYVTLSPREQIASSPYAVRTLSAAAADGLSAACIGCVSNSQINSLDGNKVTGAVATATNATQLGGIAANQYVQTNDSRLTDARNPLPGSSSYIQNQNVGPQAASNFNISGSGSSSSFNVNGPLTFGNVAPPPVAPAGQSRFYFDTATNRLRISENGGDYVNLVGASGVSGSGSANRIPFFSAATTLGDSNIFQAGTNIGIGINPQSRFHSSGTAWFSGDTTPLPAGAGKGIAIGFAGEQGYVYGFDYGAFTAKNLILNGPGGSVGIGTTAPFGKLGVNSTTYGISHTDGNVNLSTYINALGGWFGTVSNHPLHFYSSNSQPQMTLTQGALGIGTTTPLGGYRLDAAGPIRAAGDSAHFLAQTTGGTNSWARYYMRSPSQTWFMGTSQNFNGNQLYIGDETFNQTRFSIQPNGGPIYMQGGVTQDLGGYGLPKAMVYVLANGTIGRCYNGITGATTNGCGFTSTGNSGIYTVNVGFNPNQRYLSVVTSGTNESIGVRVIVAAADGVTLRTFYTNSTTTTVASDFYLIVY